MIQHSARRLVWAATFSTTLLAGCFGSTAQEDVAAARAAIDKGDRSTAIVQLKTALQKNADMPDARYLLARSLYESGNPQAADIELEKAAKLGFSETSVTPLRARLMLIRGDNAKVVELFATKKLNGTAEQVDLMTSVAMAMSAIGQIEPAVKILDEALKLDPSNRRTQLVRIRCLRSSAGPAVALREMDAFLAKNERDSEAWQTKGDLLNTDSRFDEAITAYRQAVSLNKKAAGAYSSLITLLINKPDLAAAEAALRELRAASPRGMQTQYLAAAVALEKGQLKEAREMIQQVLRVAPKDPRVLQLAANIEFKRGAWLEAESHLGKILAADPASSRARLMLAQARLRQGDAAKALSTLEPLLEGKDASPPAMSMAADASMQLGDSKAAEEWLRKIRQINPKDQRARVGLALSSYRDGKRQEAITELKAAAQESTDGVADMALLNVYLQQRDYEQALGVVDAIERKLPGKAMPHALRGKVDLARSQPDKARQDFEAALKVEPGYYAAISGLVALDVEAEHFDLAIARLQRLVDANPKNFQARMALIAVRDRAGAKPEELANELGRLVSENPSDSRVRLALVEMQLRRNENKLALSAVQDASAALPESADIWAATGKVNALVGADDQALQAFNKAIQLRPNLPQSFMPLAEYYEAKKDRASAVRTLNRALAVKADFLPANIALLRLASAAGDRNEAMKIAKNVQRVNPSSPLGFSMEGDVEAAFKASDAAAQSYREALARGDGANTAAKLNNVLLRSNKAADAAKFQADWLRAHPSDVAFMMHLGDIAIARSDWTQAEAQYRAALKLQSNNILALNNLAWVLIQAKNPAAVEVAEQANKVTPNQPPLMDTLASAYALVGKVDKALDLQKKVVALVPEANAYRVGLARYYLAAGQKDAARQELKRLSELGDKLPEQKEVQKLLAAL